MAEQAQSEPTMEEILSSIRKIIADDGQTIEEVSSDSSEADVFEQSADAISEDALDDFVDQVEDDVFDLEEAQTEEIEDDESSLFVPDDEPYFVKSADEDEIAPLSDVLGDELLTDDAEVGVAELAESELAVTDTFVEEDDEIEEFADEESSIEALPEPEEPEIEVSEPETLELVEEASLETIEEAVVSQVSETLSAAPISGADTVGAAAGSLGRLLSQVDFGDEAGGSKTIDGVVSELLRPMLKEWLDANLPEIVDKHVEAEVARIARMAR